MAIVESKQLQKSPLELCTRKANFISIMSGRWGRGRGHGHNHL